MKLGVRKRPLEPRGARKDRFQGSSHTDSLSLLSLMAAKRPHSGAGALGGGLMLRSAPGNLCQGQRRGQCKRPTVLWQANVELVGQQSVVPSFGNIVEHRGVLWPPASRGDFTFSDPEPNKMAAEQTVGLGR